MSKLKQAKKLGAMTWGMVREDYWAGREYDQLATEEANTKWSLFKMDDGRWDIFYGSDHWAFSSSLEEAMHAVQKQTLKRVLLELHGSFRKLKRK